MPRVGQDYAHLPRLGPSDKDLMPLPAQGALCPLLAQVPPVLRKRPHALPTLGPVVLGTRASSEERKMEGGRA